MEDFKIIPFCSSVANLCITPVSHLHYSNDTEDTHFRDQHKVIENHLWCPVQQYGVGHHLASATHVHGQQMTEHALV